MISGLVKGLVGVHHRRLQLPTVSKKMVGLMETRGH